MNQWLVLVKKELVESWRNFKWVWLPLVFILIGLMQPITTYYMPQIIEAAGGLPEGTLFEFPTPTGAQVLASSLADFGLIGLLILVLATMGTVSSERQSGVAAMILVKPVSYSFYITSKWAAIGLLTWVSLFLGYLTSWYYVNQLFSNVSFSYFLQSFLIYGLWLMVIMTVTLLFSTLFKSNGAIAFLSLITALLLSVTTSTLTAWMEWSPARLPVHATSILLTGETETAFATALSLSLLFVFVLLVLAVTQLKRKEMMD